jgi:hypothetical protein
MWPELVARILDGDKCGHGNGKVCRLLRPPNPTAVSSSHLSRRRCRDCKGNPRYELLAENTVELRSSHYYAWIGWNWKIKNVDEVPQISPTWAQMLSLKCPLVTNAYSRLVLEQFVRAGYCFAYIDVHEWYMRRNSFGTADLFSIPLSQQVFLSWLRAFLRLRPSLASWTVCWDDIGMTGRLRPLVLATCCRHSHATWHVTVGSFNHCVA